MATSVHKRDTAVKARKNVQAVPNAGKCASGAKRGKTCKRRQARENVQAVLSAGKYGYMYAKSCEFGVFHFSECVFFSSFADIGNLVECNCIYLLKKTECCKIFHSTSSRSHNT